MKLITLLFLLCTSLLYGQYLGSKEWSWIEGDAFQVSNLSETSDSNYLLTGQFWFNHSDSTHALLIKTDAQLNILWAKSFKAGKRNNFSQIVPTSDGNFIVGGYSHYDSNPEGPTFYKVDAAGNVIWNKRFYYSQLSYSTGDVVGIFELHDSSLLIFDQHAGVNNNAGILHLDSDGMLLSKHQLIMDFPGKTYSKGVCQGTNDVFYILLSTFDELNYSEIYYIASISPDGVDWVKKYQFERNTILKSITYLDDGHLLVAGAIANGLPDSISNVPFVFQTDLDGTPTWAHSYTEVNTPSNGYFKLMAGKNNSNFMIGGIQMLDGFSSRLMELNTFGQISWTTTLNNDPPHRPNLIKPFDDGRYFYSAFRNGDTCTVMILNEESQTECTLPLPNMTVETIEVLTSSHAFFYTNDTIGEVTPDFQSIDVDINAEEICSITSGLEERSLLTNINVFPNPTSGIVHLRLDPSYTDISLRILNAQGRFVKALNHIDSGAPIDLKDQPPGMYFLQFQNGNGMGYKKIVKL